MEIDTPPTQQPYHHLSINNSPATVSDVDDMTVNQLKSTLKAMQLPIYGCKQALRQRLLMGASPKSRSCSNHNNNSNNNSNAPNPQNNISVASTYSGSTFPMFDHQTPSSRNSSVSANMQSLNLMDTSTTSSIAECKLVELRERCKYFGLPTSGRKQEVVDRLEAYYEKALLTDLLPGAPHNNTNQIMQHEQSNCFSTGGGSFDEQHDFNAEEFNWRNELPESETKLTPVPVLALEMSNFSSQESSQYAHRSNVMVSPNGNSGSVWDKNDIATVAYQGKLEMRTILDLREACKKLGLRVAGKKAEVIARLYEHFKMTDEHHLNNSNQHNLRLMPSIPEYKHNNNIDTVTMNNEHDSPMKRKRMKVETNENELAAGIDNAVEQVDINNQMQVQSHQLLNTHQHLLLFQEGDIKSRLRSNSKSKFSKQGLPKMYLLDDSYVNSVWTCTVLGPHHSENSNMTAHCVRIGQGEPTCDCSSCNSSSIINTVVNPCKHLLFVFLKILQYTCEDNLSLVDCSHALDRMKKQKDTLVEGNNLCNICFDSCDQEQGGKGVHEECMHKWYLFKNKDSIARCKGKRNRIANNRSSSSTTNGACSNNNATIIMNQQYQ